MVQLSPIFGTTMVSFSRSGLLQTPHSLRNFWNSSSPADAALGSHKTLWQIKGVQTLSLGGYDSVPQQVQKSGGLSPMLFLDTSQFYLLSGWPCR